MTLVVRALLLLLMTIVPALVSAETLDDYYLSRLAPAERSAPRTLTGIVDGQPVAAERCQTGVRRGARLDWDKLQPSTQEILAKELSRPVLQGERILTPVGGHFNFHYATSGSDAPDLSDSKNNNGVPDWVETVAGVFEYVYQIEVNKMGYKAPPVARYDVYLRDLVPRGAYGVTADDGIPALPGTSAASYIEIDRAFSNPIFTLNGLYSKEQMLQITAAHEFHHAIQFGYNYYFDFWYAEVTATWIEDEIYDSVNQLYGYLRSYVPLASTIALNAPLGANSEYGRWIFNRYLTETHGSRTVVRSIWEAVGKLPAPGDGSDIPMLPVIQGVLQNNLGNNFFGFARKMLLRDWAATRLADIPSIPNVAVNSFTVAGSVTAQAPPEVASKPFTFVFYRYTPSSVSDQALVINLPDLSSNLAVSAFKRDELGWREEYAYNSISGNVTVPSFTADSTVYLLICNNGGDRRSPTAVTPLFSADASLVSDGTGLDGNTLEIPSQSPIPAQTETVRSGGGGGGCFIATAAYGSYLHPKVAELRDFRDRYLLTNAPGRLFVSLYYWLSPPVAQVIGKHEWMRGAARGLLLPVILAVEQPVAALAVLLLSGGGLVGLTRRRGLNRMEPVWSKGGL